MGDYFVAAIVYDNIDVQRDFVNKYKEQKNIGTELLMNPISQYNHTLLASRPQQTGRSSGETLKEPLIIFLTKQTDDELDNELPGMVRNVIDFYILSKDHDSYLKYILRCYIKGDIGGNAFKYIFEKHESKFNNIKSLEGNKAIHIALLEYANDREYTLKMRLLKYYLTNTKQIDGEKGRRDYGKAWKEIEEKINDGAIVNAEDAEILRDIIEKKRKGEPVEPLPLFETRGDSPVFYAAAPEEAAPEKPGIFSLGLGLTASTSSFQRLDTGYSVFLDIHFVQLSIDGFAGNGIIEPKTDDSAAVINIAEFGISCKLPFEAGRFRVFPLAGASAQFGISGLTPAIFPRLHIGAGGDYLFTKRLYLRVALLYSAALGSVLKGNLAGDSRCAAKLALGYAY